MSEFIPPKIPPTHDTRLKVGGYTGKVIEIPTAEEVEYILRHKKRGVTAFGIAGRWYHIKTDEAGNRYCVRVLDDYTELPATEQEDLKNIRNWANS